MAGSRCTVCDHPERKAIETALAASPERSIAKQWSLSDSTVHRHKVKHLRPAVAKAIATRTALHAEALAQRLLDLLETVDDAVSKAKDANDLKTLSSLVRESRELVVTIGRGYLGLWTDHKPSITVDARRQTIQVLGNLTTDELRSLARMAPAIESEARPC